MLPKAFVCYLPLWKGKKLCVFHLKSANASGILCLGFFFFNSPFKTHVLDFLISSHKKRGCSVSVCLLELYCQEPSWPLALVTENAAHERMEYSLGRAFSWGGGIPRLVAKGRTWHSKEVAEKTFMFLET